MGRQRRDKSGMTECAQGHSRPPGSLARAHLWPGGHLTGHEAMKGYRTYLVSGLVALFGALALVDWNALIANPKDGWIAVVSGVLMAVMRSVTTTPPPKP